MFKLTNADTIVLHCSASETCSIEDLKKWHIEEDGWDDIGYHFLIRKDGSLHRGRSIEYQGAHVKGDNDHTVGICLEGEGLDQFTDEQYEQLAKTIKELTRANEVNFQVKGHFQFESAKKQGKTCPLANEDESFDELLAEIIAKMIDIV